MLYDYFTLISNSYFTKTKEAKELFVEQETPKKYTMKYQYEN